MTNTDTANAPATLAQIRALRDAGCELVRVTVNAPEAAEALKTIVRESPLPVAADIHFDYRLALAAIRSGVHKLRLNPGNIGSAQKVREVASAAKDAGIPIRIGVNGGSLEREILQRHGKATPAAMVESALKHAELLEKNGFTDIVISLKSSHIRTMIAAYREMSRLRDYPLHLGVTEAGTAFQGSIKSAVGIGSLLADGIGDTIRVSLTEDPVEEIRVAKEILKVLGLRKEGVEIISCPTCGRTEIDLITLTKKVEKAFEGDKRNIRIAVMGCVVNGPGEAREADFGVAGGRGVGLLFRKGEIYKKVTEEEILPELQKMAAQEKF
jgi:(E)-4-hydroxy-3-methylbut-2-enyl-diphosphate synthase